MAAGKLLAPMDNCSAPDPSVSALLCVCNLLCPLGPGGIHTGAHYSAGTGRGWAAQPAQRPVLAHPGDGTVPQSLLKLSC
jgi:hypothetical protein